MAWRIHAWDATSATGEVVSSHFGPWRFDGAPGDAFEVGEDVLVQLDGPPGSYRVSNVRPARQRQPEGTQTPELEAINARRHESCHVEEQSAHTLRLWLGSCCPWCGPSLTVTYRGVRTTAGLGEDTDLDLPLFRVASDDERRRHELVAADGEQVYCIVTNHGFGPDGPCVFIVARSVVTAPYRRPPAEGLP